MLDKPRASEQVKSDLMKAIYILTTLKGVYPLRVLLCIVQEGKRSLSSHYSKDPSLIN